MGAELLPAGFSGEARIARYRAPANTCNACMLKERRTDSDEGREITQQMDSWIGSELRRFHAGISLSLLLLAALIAVAEIFRHSEVRELLVLLPTAAVIFLAGRHMLSRFLALRGQGMSPTISS